MYGKYGINQISALALRAEVFSNPDSNALGSGLAQDVKEVIITYEYKFMDALLVRGELRDDFSNVTGFDKSISIGTEDNQLTFLIGVVIIF